MTAPTWTLAVSTLLTPELRIRSFLDQNEDKLHQFEEVLLICQQGGNPNRVLTIPGKLSANIRIVDCLGRGISASRNEGIRSLSTEFIWFMDDDVQLTDEISTVKRALARSPAEINCLRIQDTCSDALYKTYGPERNLSSLELLKVSSIEITCKRSFLEKTGLRFPEWLGIGTTIPSGEENLFLRRAKATGATVRHLPLIACRHPILRADMRVIWSRPNRMRAMGIVARSYGVTGVLLCLRWSTRAMMHHLPLNLIGEMWQGYFSNPIAETL